MPHQQQDKEYHYPNARADSYCYSHTAFRNQVEDKRVIRKAYGLDKASGNGSLGGGAANEGVQKSRGTEEVVVVMLACLSIRKEASARRGDA